MTRLVGGALADLRAPRRRRRRRARAASGTVRCGVRAFDVTPSPRRALHAIAVTRRHAQAGPRAPRGRARPDRRPYRARGLHGSKPGAVPSKDLALAELAPTGTAFLRSGRPQPTHEPAPARGRRGPGRGDDDGAGAVPAVAARCVRLRLSRAPRRAGCPPDPPSSSAPGSWAPPSPWSSGRAA